MKALTTSRSPEVPSHTAVLQPAPNQRVFGFLMMDNLFFLDKVQTGPYWHANELYGLKLRSSGELYLKNM